MIEKKTYSKLVTDAADIYIGHDREIDEGIDVYMQREAFKEGADWMGKDIERLQ